MILISFGVYCFIKYSSMMRGRETLSQIFTLCGFMGFSIKFSLSLQLIYCWFEMPVKYTLNSSEKMVLSETLSSSRLFINHWVYSSLAAGSSEVSCIALILYRKFTYEFRWRIFKSLLHIFHKSAVRFTGCLLIAFRLKLYSVRKLSIVLTICLQFHIFASK